MRKIGAIIALALVCSCRGYMDPRCYQEYYYCITTESGRQSYLQRVTDRHLLTIARMEYRTSRPPSAFYVVKEMERRGGVRARLIVQDYSTGAVDQRLLDEMVRIFTPSGALCRKWALSAPSQGHQTLQASCNRVYSSHSMEQLRSAADEARKPFR